MTDQELVLLRQWNEIHTDDQAITCRITGTADNPYAVVTYVTVEGRTLQQAVINFQPVARFMGDNGLEGDIPVTDTEIAWAELSSPMNGYADMLRDLKRRQEQDNL